MKKDQTGHIYGRLTVLREATKEDFQKYHVHRQNRCVYWICQCVCGNFTCVNGTSLRSGNTKSCGCLSRENLEKGRHKFTDITGHRYGRLTALYMTSKMARSNHVWHCKCDCGNEVDVSINDLTMGNTSSCGCIKRSKGEAKIKDILDANHIKYVQQYSFNDCKDKRRLTFDFYIPQKNYLIEFDGRQHFQAVGGFMTEERVQYTKQHDKIKNEYCKQHSIPLIRIPYTHLKDFDIKDLLIQTTRFLI